METGTWLGMTVLLLSVSAAPAQGLPASVEAEEASGPAPGVVATVNGRPVLFEDLERRLQAAHGDRSASTRDAYNIDRLMERVINDELLAQEARALGIHEDGVIKAKLDNERRNLALGRLEDEEIESKVKVSDDELAKAFRVEYATVSFHVVTASEREQAEELLQQLREGADFESLAREHSVDPYAVRGGKVENQERVDLSIGVAGQAWSTKPGEYAGPIVTALGFSVLRVDSFGEADPEKYDSVKGWLEDQLRFRKSEGLRKKLGERLRESFEVTVDTEAVEAIGVGTETDGSLAPRLEDPSKVVATAAGRSITAEELGRALRERWRGVRNERAALASRKIVLERLVMKELMVAEAEKREYGESPEIQRALRALEKELIVRRYIRDFVAPKVTVSEDELKSYYEAHIDDFRKLPRLHVSQITVAEEDEAERIVGLLRQGTDAAWLARMHSIDRFKEAGGDRGWVLSTDGGGFPREEFETIQPGDVLGPLGAPGNYIVFKVNAREEQGNYSFERVAANIRSVVFSQKFREYHDEYLERLRSRSEIEIHEEVLAALEISGESSEAPASGHGHH